MVGHPISQIKMRYYMDKRDTPPKRVTSPTWGSLPLCKQTLCHYHLVIYVSMKFYYYEIRIPGSHYYTMCAINMSGLMAIVTTSQSLRKTTSFHGLTGDPKSEALQKIILDPDLLESFKYYTRFRYIRGTLFS